MNDTSLVPVQREWHGWQTTEVPLGDLHEIHWLRPSGAPRAIVHAYVPVNKLGSATQDQTSQHVLGERQLVCILKSQAPATVYAHLASRADEAAHGGFCGASA